MLVIRTPRLELVAASPEIARAEALGAPDWHEPLYVRRPPAWPPPLNDRRSLSWFARSIEQNPAALGWFGWYVVRRDCRSGPGTLAGNCGFKGEPNAHGSVEVGYALLEPFQRQGYGTELTSALIGWAFGHAAVQRVLAETYPELVGSIRLLEKHGFQAVGRGSTPGLLLFELRRRVYEQRRRTEASPAHS